MLHRETYSRAAVGLTPTRLLPPPDRSAGLLQATGWPSVVSVMANWFGKASHYFLCCAAQVAWQLLCTLCLHACTLATVAHTHTHMHVSNCASCVCLPTLQGKRGLIMGIWNAHTSVGERSSWRECCIVREAPCRVNQDWKRTVTGALCWLQTARFPVLSAPTPTPNTCRQHCGQPDCGLHAALRLGLVLHRAWSLHRCQR